MACVTQQLTGWRQRVADCASAICRLRTCFPLGGGHVSDGVFNEGSTDGRVRGCIDAWMRGCVDGWRVRCNASFPCGCFCCLVFCVSPPRKKFVITHRPTFLVASLPIRITVTALFNND